MELIPDTAPIFGGQYISIKVDPLLFPDINAETINNEKIYLKFTGKNLSHLSTVSWDERDMFTLITENDIAEEQSVEMYKLVINEVNETASSEEIKLIYNFNKKFTYLNDDIKSTVNEYLSSNFDYVQKHLKVKELYDKNITYLETDDSVDNFDNKISTLLKLKNETGDVSIALVTDKEYTTNEKEFLRYLNLKCLFKTRNHFFPRENTLILPNEECGVNFIYKITNLNLITHYNQTAFMKEYTKSGIFSLTFTTINLDFTIVNQIESLNEFCKQSNRILSGSEFEQNNFEGKSKSRTILLQSTSSGELCLLTEDFGKFDNKDDAKSDNDFDNDIHSENKLQSSTPIHLPKEKLLFKSQTFKSDVPVKEDDSKSKIYNRNSIDNVSPSLKKNVTFKINSKQTQDSRKENKSPDRKSAAQNQLKAETPSLTTEKLDQSPSSVVRNTMYEKSPPGEKNSTNMLSMEEFLQKEIQNIKNDTSFQSVNIKKSTIIRGGNFFKKIFKKDRSNDLIYINEKGKKSTILMNINKGTYSSSSNIGNNNKLRSSNKSDGFSLHTSTIEIPTYDSETSNESLGHKILEDSETWSEFADQKVIKKMSQKEVKRQDVIYELIKTENGFVKILKTIHKVYFNGLLRQLNFTRSTIDILVPKIVDLLAIHGTFLASLMQLQSQNDHLLINNISDTCLIQFSAPMNQKLVDVYGYICSRQQESVELYKDLLKSNKKFHDFVEACNNYTLLRRLTLPECLTFITQRIVKYPLLLEAILRCTKENDKEYAQLNIALSSCKDVVNKINLVVRDYENQKELTSIKARLDLKSECLLRNNEKIKIVDLFKGVTTLLKMGSASIKSKNRMSEIMILALGSFVILLHENNNKLSLCPLETRSPVLAFRNLMIRTVATDPRSLFFVDKGNAEIYEIAFPSNKECIEWLKLLTTHSTIEATPNGRFSKNCGTYGGISSVRNTKLSLEKLSKVFNELNVKHKEILTKMKMLYKLTCKSKTSKCSNSIIEHDSLSETKLPEYKYKLSNTISSLLLMSGEIHKEPSSNNNDRRGRTQTFFAADSDSTNVNRAYDIENLKQARINKDRLFKSLHTSSSEIWSKIRTIMTMMRDIIDKEDNFMSSVKRQFDCVISIVTPQMDIFDPLVDFLTKVDDFLSLLVKVKTQINDANTILQLTYDTKESKGSYKKDAKDILATLVDTKNNIYFCDANQIELRNSCDSDIFPTDLLTKKL